MTARTALRAWVRLLRVHKVLLAEVRDEMQGDVTLPRFDLLSNLERRDGQTLAELSRCMLVTAGNLTGLVDRAERDGLVERRAVVNDRRARHVHLTRRGKKVFTDASARHATRIAKRMAMLNEADLNRLSALCDVLLADDRDRENDHQGNGK